MLRKLIFLVLGCLLAACSSTVPTASVTEITAPPEGTAYPYPILKPVYEAPYPVEVTDPPAPAHLQTPVQVPEPKADKGVVTGSLINLQTGERMPFQTVYLGYKVYLTPAPAYAYHILEKSSPQTITDLNGDFAIGDVPEGDYVLMVWTPFGAYVVMDGGKELMVNVEAGKVLDLGELQAIDPIRNNPTP